MKWTEKPVYVEIEDDTAEVRRVDRTEHSILKTGSRFVEAIAQVKPAANAVFTVFREMNTPDEIGLESGIKFGAKAGAFLASADSEATFKVSLKWKNEKKDPAA